MLRRSKVTLRSTSNKPDFFLIGLVLGLSAFGIIMVANASVVEALRDFGDKLYYFKLQAQWAIVGLIAFLFFQRYNHRHLKIFAVPLMIFTLVALIMVLLPGVSMRVLGAKRWLSFGPIKFQPGELAKFSFILWSAAFLSKKRKFLPFFALMGIIIGLIMLEPDLGTTIVVAASGFAVFFASGAPLWQIFSVAFFGMASGLGLIFSSSYRLKRVMTFLDPNNDPLGASYHIRQVLIALGSGGLFGVGLGQSRQKYEYLPAVTTDSIFAVIAEEAGFIGSFLVILCFMLIIWRGLKIASQAPDEFSRLLALGITSWIGLQALINIAAMAALVPLTGIPLPFVSYGGSSLVLALTGAGILVNVSRYKVVKK